MKTYISTRHLDEWPIHTARDVDPVEAGPLLASGAIFESTAGSTVEAEMPEPEAPAGTATSAREEPKPVAQPSRKKAAG